VGLAVRVEHHQIIRVADHRRSVSLAGKRPFAALLQTVQSHVGQQGGEHAANNVAKRPLEFFIRLAREQLRPTYGQGFHGAPLQPDTEELHPQPIRAGGSRAKVIQSTSEVSRSEEEV
jgi:hypothetical protein